MSIVVSDTRAFKNFLRDATFQPIGKNKIRKDLLTKLSECTNMVFIAPGGQYVIAESYLNSITSFLNKDGRSDTLKDDEALSFITTISSLRRDYSHWEEDMNIMATHPVSLAASAVSSPEHKQQDAPRARSDPASGSVPSS